MENIVNKNPGDYTGWTPLHSAAQNGHLIVVKPILSSLSAGHVQLTNMETLHLTAVFFETGAMPTPTESRNPTNCG